VSGCRIPTSRRSGGSICTGLNRLIFPLANKVVEIEIDDSLAKEVNAVLTANDKTSIKLSPALQQLGYGKFLL
jgi:hypothetical protein